jgi:hypothetical protein
MNMMRFFTLSAWMMLWCLNRRVFKFIQFSMFDNSLGGFTSRGLGEARLEIGEISQVDFNDPKQRNDYLIERKWQPMDIQEFNYPLRTRLGA